MQTLFIIVVIVLYSLQTLFCKLYSDKFKGKKRADNACILYSGKCGNRPYIAGI